MKRAIKQGLGAGITFGIIFIFLLLIGFILIATKMIGNFLGNLENLATDALFPLENLVILTGLLSLVSGFTSQKEDRDAPRKRTIFCGLFAGLSSAFLVAILILLVGNLHIGGTDFRTYLPNLGPDQIEFLLFYNTPQKAALIYGFLILLFSMIGAIIKKLLEVISQRRTIQKSFSLNYGKCNGTSESRKY